MSDRLEKAPKTYRFPIYKNFGSTHGGGSSLCGKRQHLWLEYEMAGAEHRRWEYGCNPDFLLSQHSNERMAMSNVIERVGERHKSAR